MRRWAILSTLFLSACAAASAGSDVTRAPSAAETTTTTAPVAVTTSSTAASTTTASTAPAIDSDDPAPLAVISPTGVVLPVIRDIDPGWIVETPCANPAILIDGSPVDEVTVLIDPGHGGDETGAVGDNGLRESDLNLDIAERLSGYLEDRGVPTLLTRTADYRMAIAARATLARTVAPAVFISVHHNGGPTDFIDAPGTVVFHQIESEQSRRLGGLVYEELVGALSELEIRYEAGLPPGAFAMLNDEGGDYYGVLRRTVGVTSVLSEAMFLTNPAEAAALEEPLVRDLEARALGDAIIRFLSTDEPGSGYLEARTFQGPDSGTGRTEGCVDPPLIPGDE